MWVLGIPLVPGATVCVYACTYTFFLLPRDKEDGRVRTAHNYLLHVPHIEPISALELQLTIATNMIPEDTLLCLPFPQYLPIFSHTVLSLF